MLYTLGAMFVPLSGMVLLPLYTNYLSPSSYGILTTVQTLSGALQLVLILAINGAITRFYYDYLDNKILQKKYLGSILLFVSIYSLLIVNLFLLFKEFIGQLIFENIPTDPFIYYLVFLAWSSGLLTLPLALLRAREKAGTFAVINISHAIINTFLTFIILKFLSKGIEELLTVLIITNFCIFLISLLIQKKHFTISLDWKMIKSSLIFSIPLIPHVASAWIISSSDRIILEKNVPLSEIGIYSLSVQVSLVLALFFSSINNALVPRYTLYMKNQEHQKANQLLIYFQRSIIFFGMISIPVAVLGVEFFISEEYEKAIYIIPFLIISQILRGLYYIPVSRLFFYKDTKAIATGSSLAAMINVIFNLCLIPIIGLYGAIVSSYVGEISRLFLIQHHSKKYKRRT